MEFSRIAFSFRDLAAALAVLAVTVCTSPALAEAEDQADSPDEAVVEWLDKLEQRGREIETFAANVTHERESVLHGETQIRLGKLWYVAADDDGPARFAVQFDQLVIDDALRERDHAYIFDGEWLVERNGDRKLFQKRQVVPPGERFDPLQVDGPFPLPIGQKRDEVLERFDVEFVEDEQGDDDLVHLRLEPREDVAREQGEAEFDVVEMWFNRETLLPERVETRERQNRTTVTLTEQRVNELSEQELADRFDTEPPPDGSGWRVEITPFRE